VLVHWCVNSSASGAAEGSHTLTTTWVGEQSASQIAKHTHQKPYSIVASRHIVELFATSVSCGRRREQKVRSAANVCQLESCSSAAEAGVARRIAAASQRKTRLPPPAPVTTTNECRGKVDPGGRRSRNTTTVASSTSSTPLQQQQTTTPCASSVSPPPTRPSSTPNTVWIHSMSRVSTQSVAHHYLYSHPTLRFSKLCA
jgi:hypothetical protein